MRTSGEQSKSEKHMHLPQVDKVLRHPILESLATSVRREVLTQLIRQQLDSWRSQHKTLEDVPSVEQVARSVADKVRALQQGAVRRVLNGTGVILNTNLGRAPLPAAAVERANQILPGYCSLEIDLRSGKRGERTAVLSELFSLLTGCESAIVVNNNAAAVLLTICALAAGKEVIVSRGELIEIGGSFRLPDVIVSGGGILREVGTTNRTRISDYKNALTPNTGLLLKCHRSNYEIVGFTQEPLPSELVELSRECGIPFVEDLGSGALFDVTQIGLRQEPTVDAVLKSGVDLVLFSGDKLLGGTQAGILAGRSSLVEKLRHHPIYRTLRADKLVTSLLESVVASYLHPLAQTKIPSLSMACLSTDLIRNRVTDFIEGSQTMFKNIRCVCTETESTFGGGTLPGQLLPSFGIEICTRLASDNIAAALRSSTPPVIAFQKDDRVVIDFRTISQNEEADLLRVLGELDANIQKLLNAQC